MCSAAQMPQRERCFKEMHSMWDEWVKTYSNLFLSCLFLLGCKLGAENEVSKEKQQVKNLIDLRVDKIKNELEMVRDDLHREVDQIGDEALE